MENISNDFVASLIVTLIFLGIFLPIIIIGKMEEKEFLNQVKEYKRKNRE